MLDTFSFSVTRTTDRGILDAALSCTLSLIRYKAKEAGTDYLELSTRKWKPTQRCWLCLVIVPKSLSDRMHRCPCGQVLPRDHNPALLFRRVGLMHFYGRSPADGHATAPAAATETPSIAASAV